MNFGERLKQLRQSKDWSQPELAQAIGIEQSYLSKLENDKSVPSPDMLNRILEAFDIDIETLLQGMDESEIRNHLRSIPLVNGHLQAQKENARRKRSRWVIGSALLCVFGISTIVIGIGFIVNPIVAYDYGSEEIVPNGAAGETFNSLGSFMGYKLAPTLDDLISRNVNSAEMNEQSNRAYSSFELQYSSLVLLRTNTVMSIGAILSLKELPRVRTLSIFRPLENRTEALARLNCMALAVT